jgi:hypothetical protein
MKININIPSIAAGLVAGLIIAASIAAADPTGNQPGRYQLTVSEGTGGAGFTRTYLTDTETGKVREQDQAENQSSFCNTSSDVVFEAAHK